MGRVNESENREHSEKPLITFALIAYNQEKYIKEAIEGAFSQTYSPLEIILSDDCSTDATFDIMMDIIKSYKGPHDILLNRNVINLGIGEHVNKIMELSHGQLVIIAAGDDISIPQRAVELHNIYYGSNMYTKSIFSNMEVIDQSGNKLGLFGKGISKEKLTPEWFIENLCSVYGASQAWDRRLFEFFGPIHKGVINEDHIIPFRAALVGDVFYYEKPLIYYRRHGLNVWKSSETMECYKNWKYRRFDSYDNISNIYRNWLCDLKLLERNRFGAQAYGLSSRIDKKEGVRLAEKIEKKINYYEDQKCFLNDRCVSRVMRTIFPTYKEATMNMRIRWLILSVVPRAYYYVLKARKKLYETGG